MRVTSQQQAESESSKSNNLPKQVQGSIQVSDGDNLTTDVVVKAVTGRGVNEAIANPQCRLNVIFDLTEWLLVNRTINL